MTALAQLIQPSEAAAQAVEQKLHLTWEQFLSTIMEIDTRLIREGMEISARPLAADREICRRSGRQWMMIAFERDPITELVHQVYQVIYGKENLYVGSLHVGAIMLRDAYFEVHVPYGYGTVRIDFWKMVADLSEEQKHAFAVIDPEEYLINTDQLVDIFDFGWAADDILHKKDEMSVDE